MADPGAGAVARKGFYSAQTILITTLSSLRKEPMLSSRPLLSWALHPAGLLLAAWANPSPLHPTKQRKAVLPTAGLSLSFLRNNQACFERFIPADLNMQNALFDISF
jgi:hypothetical protein